jgi:hypothetical protein
MNELWNTDKNLGRLEFSDTKLTVRECALILLFTCSESRSQSCLSSALIFLTVGQADPDLLI